MGHYLLLCIFQKQRLKSSQDLNIMLKFKIKEHVGLYSQELRNGEIVDLRKKEDYLNDHEITLPVVPLKNDSIEIDGVGFLIRSQPEFIANSEYIRLYVCFYYSYNKNY